MGSGGIVSRNRYVGDYRIVETVDERGRIRSDYEYIGAPYVYVESETNVKDARRCGIVACLFGWVCFLTALIPVSAAAHTLYVCLPFVFSCVPLALMTGMMFTLYRTEEPFEHRHADRLENRAPAYSFLVMLFTALAVAGEAVSALRGAQMLRGDAVFTLGAIGLFTCSFCLHRQWKRLRCRRAA